MKWANKLCSRLGMLAVAITVVLPLLSSSNVAYGSAGCPGGCGGPGPSTSIGTFVYPEGYKDQLLTDIKSNKKDDTTFFQSDIAVYIKNPGSVPGGQPIEAAYNQPRSQANGNDRYSFGITYDCTTSGIASTDLTPSTPHWTISYIVDQQLSQNFDSDQQIQGSAYYNHIIHLPTGGNVGSASNGPIRTPQLGAPASCFPYTTGNILLDNYNQLSAANQALYPANAATIAAYAPASGPTPPSSGFDDACNADQSSGALGWIMCSVIEVADKGINTIIEKILKPELTVTPLSTHDPSYAVWQSMQTLANVFFVIIFLVIIFANTVRLNIESYTIKKMLPKLVASVILVQFSYVISSVIIDVGNILGDGIVGLVNVGVLHGVATTPTGTLSFLQGALGFAAIGLLIIAVPGLLVLAVTALIGAAGVLITLVVRQLLIIMLVVLSPLAFAAWVLPNTERFFKMWLTNFIKVSLMFAIIMLLFALASIGTYTQSHSPSYDNTSGLQGIIASLFPIIAFFMVPMTFKWAGGAMSFASGYVADRTGKAKSWGGDKARNSRPVQARAAAKAQKRQQRLINAVGDEEGRYSRFIPQRLGKNKVIAGRQAVARRWATGTLRPNRGYAAKQIEDLEHQQIHEYENLHKGKSVENLKSILADPKTNKTEAKAVAGLISQQGAFDQTDVTAMLLRKYGVTGKRDAKGKLVGDLEGAQKAWRYARDRNYGALKKDNFAMLDFDLGDGMTGDSIEMFDHDIKDAAGNIVHKKGDVKVTAGAKMVKTVREASGAQIANQTNKGFSLLATATDASGRTLKEYVTQTAKDSIKQAPTLKAAVSGNPLASEIIGIPISQNGGDDLGALDNAGGDNSGSEAPAPEIVAQPLRVETPAPSPVPSTPAPTVATPRPASPSRVTVEIPTDYPSQKRFAEEHLKDIPADKILDPDTVDKFRSLTASIVRGWVEKTGRPENARYPGTVAGILGSSPSPERDYLVNAINMKGGSQRYMEPSEILGLKFDEVMRDYFGIDVTADNPGYHDTFG